jgi:predicted HNH restriction endonuclease
MPRKHVDEIKLRDKDHVGISSRLSGNQPRRFVVAHERNPQCLINLVAIYSPAATVCDSDWERQSLESPVRQF